MPSPGCTPQATLRGQAPTHVRCAGRFPFASAADAKLNAAEAVQVMFQRILTGSFIPLAWISQPCTDLLHSMLCVDPSKRIDINGVLHHPWFLQGVPRQHLKL